MKRDTPSNADKAAARQAMADRRRKVAALALARVSQQEIARQLNVSEATISKDLAFARAQWAAERTADIAAERTQELARLAADEAQWRRKMQTEPGLLGQLGIYDRIHRIGERRARILGLDAPTKQELYGKDGAALGIVFVERAAGGITPGADGVPTE